MNKQDDFEIEIRVQLIQIWGLLEDLWKKVRVLERGDLSEEEFVKKQREDAEKWAKKMMDFFKEKENG